MKVSSRTYTLSIERQEDGYLAHFPALLGCHTWGKTYEAAVRNAEEALELYLETLAAHGDPFPDDQVVVRVSGRHGSYSGHFLMYARTVAGRAGLGNRPSIGARRLPF
jgi:predicted RNase H-like HicB family nuclease